MQINRVALDLAKQVIQVHAVNRSGRALVRKSVRRSRSGTEAVKPAIPTVGPRKL